MLPKIEISGRDFAVNGQPFMLRGFQIGDGDFNATTEAWFQQVAAMKVNCLRLWLQMNTYMPTSTGVNEANLAVLNHVIELADKYGIYVVLSNGMYKIGPFLPGGYGLPQWVFTDCGFTPTSEAECWPLITYEGCVQQNIGQFLSLLAEVGLNHSNVVGVDLMNEPQIRGLPATQLYNNLSLHVTEKDPGQLQCVAANFIDYSVRPSVPNLFVVGHGYMGFSAAHFQDQEWMDNAFKSYYWVTGENFNCPLFNIEWMLVRTQAELDGYTRDFGLLLSDVPTWYETYIKGMENNRISWCHYPSFYLWESQHWISGAGQKVKDYWQLNETIPGPEPPPEPPAKTLIARVPMLPLSMLQILYRMRQKVIRPEVHKKIHPVI